MKLGRIRAREATGLPTTRDLLAAVNASDRFFETIAFFQKAQPYPLLGNDTVGDCTCVGASHVIQTWTSLTDAQPVVMTTERVIALYSQVSGYVPGNPETDRGALCIDVLKHWAGAGIDTPGGGPDVLSGAAVVTDRSPKGVRQVMGVFGPLYVGLALPLSAQTEGVWASVYDPPGSWGGHCVAIVGADAVGPVCVTWGQLKQMTWAFWESYLEEAYALLSHDWMKANGISEEGLNWAQMAASLSTSAAQPILA